MVQTFTISHSKWFYTFALLTTAVGAIYRHWLGIIVFEILILLILFGFYIKTVMNEKLCYNMMQTMAIGSLVAAAAAFAQKIPEVSYRSLSFFVNANYYAYSCETVLIVLIYALYRYGASLLYFAAIAADIGGIIASGCRSAWPALFCGIIVVMVCLKKYRHLITLSTAGVLTGIATLCLPRLLFPRFTTISSDTSLRFLIWNTALGYIKSHPLFGQGMLSYYLLSAGRAHDIHAHDLILDILLNFGMVGAAIITVLMVFAISDLIRNLRVNPVGAIALGVMTETFIHGFTDVPFIGMQTGPLLIVIISLAGRCGSHSMQETGVTNKPPLP